MAGNERIFCTVQRQRLRSHKTQKASNRSLTYLERPNSEAFSSRITQPFRTGSIRAKIADSRLYLPLRHSFNVNQVDSDFMPFRSMLAPSHTAKAIGTDMPALNWTSFASPFSNVRFTTTRHVGPE